MANKKISRGAYARIQSTYSTLLPAEKQIADFILKNAEKIEELSINELASYAQTSKSTVTRFCQRLGYDGFKQFRLSAAKDHVMGFDYSQELSDEETNTADLVQNICQSNARACLDTPLLLDPESLEKATRILLKAKRIFIFGDGPVASVAIDFFQKMLRLGLFCVYSMDRRFQQMQAVLTTKEDAVIAFDLAGSTKSTITAIKSARNNGSKTIAVTNTVGAPITKEAELILFGPGRIGSHLTGTLEPRIVQLCIVDCLFTLLVKLSGEKANANLKKTKEVILSDWV